MFPVVPGKNGLAPERLQAHLVRVRLHLSGIVNLVLKFLTTHRGPFCLEQWGEGYTSVITVNFVAPGPYHRDHDS